MKLKLVGGTIKVPVAVNNKREMQERKVTSLQQDCCGASYVWPKVGSVLSVPDDIGHWIRAKNPGVLEMLPEAGEGTKSNTFVAIVPEDVAQQPGPAKPQVPTK